MSTKFIPQSSTSYIKQRYCSPTRRPYSRTKVTTNSCHEQRPDLVSVREQDIVPHNHCCPHATTSHRLSNPQIGRSTFRIILDTKLASDSISAAVTECLALHSYHLFIYQQCRTHSTSSPIPRHQYLQMCLQTFRTTSCPHLSIVTYPCNLLTSLFTKYPHANPQDCADYRTDQETTSLMCLKCEKEKDPNEYRPILPIRWTVRPEAQSWPKRCASLKKEGTEDGQKMSQMSASERAIESLVKAAERVAMEEWWI